MGQVGARVDSPVTLLREYLAALRALLRGERVTTRGRYINLTEVALDWPPAPAPAIFAGAIGPKSLRLCGEAADGTIMVAGTSPEALIAARRLVDEGRAAAGRDEPHEVVVYVHAATGPDAAQRLTGLHEVAAWGSAESVAAAVKRWVEAGADRVILQPTPDDPDPEGFVRFVGSEVRPLLGTH